MKTPKRNREEVRTNSITILTTAEEKANIEAAAEKMGVTKSTFIRIVVKDFIKKQEV